MVYLRYLPSKNKSIVKTCRFCMLPEPERIALETPNFVVLLGLGPIAVGYCIIITKTHLASYAKLPKGQLPEFKQLVGAVQETQKKIFGASVLFEHGRNGGCLPHGHDDELCYHAHMHLLPATADLARVVSHDYEYQVLAGLEDLSRTARRSTYLLVQDGSELNCTVNPRALPPRYLRTKVAEQVLNDATLADWQAFPSYDLVRQGKEAIQAQLQLAWRARRGTIDRWASFTRVPQLRKPAERMKSRL